MDERLRVRVADFGLARVVHDLTTLTGGQRRPAPRHTSFECVVSEAGCTSLQAQPGCCMTSMIVVSLLMIDVQRYN